VNGQMVSLDKWLPWYKAIVAEMGYDEGRDLKACGILAKILSPSNVEETWTEVRRLIENKEVIVWGAGPNLIEGIQLVKERRRRRSSF